MKCLYDARTSATVTAIAPAALFRAVFTASIDCVTTAPIYNRVVHKTDLFHKLIISQKLKHLSQTLNQIIITNEDKQGDQLRKGAEGVKLVAGNVQNFERSHNEVIG